MYVLTSFQIYLNRERLPSILNSVPQSHKITTPTWISSCQHQHLFEDTSQDLLELVWNRWASCITHVSFSCGVYTYDHILALCCMDLQYSTRRDLWAHIVPFHASDFRKSMKDVLNYIYENIQYHTETLCGSTHSAYGLVKKIHRHPIVPPIIRFSKRSGYFFFESDQY